MRNNIRYILQALYICLFISSCQSLDKEVQEALNNASSQQREELSIFIAHYSAKKEIQKDAKFIVANLTNKYSIIGKNNATYQEYMDSIQDDTTTVNSRKGYNYKNAIGRPVKRRTLQRLQDIDILRADSLIAHLNTAYRLWEQSPWQSVYSKDIFRKYILPYRIADESIEYYWRADAHMRNNGYLDNYKDSILLSEISDNIEEAVPYSGYQLVSFTGGPIGGNSSQFSGASQYGFNVNNQDWRFSVSFKKEYTIAVSADTGGSVSGGGTVLEGENCTVNASANSGYSFEGWYEGNTKVSSSASYTFAVSSNRTFCFYLT